MIYYSDGERSCVKYLENHEDWKTIRSDIWDQEHEDRCLSSVDQELELTAFKIFFEEMDDGCIFEIEVRYNAENDWRAIYGVRPDLTTILYAN